MAYNFERKTFISLLKSYERGIDHFITNNQDNLKKMVSFYKSLEMISKMIETNLTDDLLKLLFENDNIEGELKSCLIKLITLSKYQKDDFSELFLSTTKKAMLEVASEILGDLENIGYIMSEIGDSIIVDNHEGLLEYFESLYYTILCGCGESNTLYLRLNEIGFFNDKDVEYKYECLLQTICNNSNCLREILELNEFPDKRDEIIGCGIWGMVFQAKLGNYSEDISYINELCSDVKLGDDEIKKLDELNKCYTKGIEDLFYQPFRPY